MTTSTTVNFRKYVHEPVRDHLMHTAYKKKWEDLASSNLVDCYATSRSQCALEFNQSARKECLQVPQAATMSDLEEEPIAVFAKVYKVNGKKSLKDIWEAIITR